LEENNGRGKFRWEDVPYEQPPREPPMAVEPYEAIKDLLDARIKEMDAKLQGAVKETDAKISAIHEKLDAISFQLRETLKLRWWFVGVTIASLGVMLYFIREITSAYHSELTAVISTLQLINK